MSLWFVTPAWKRYALTEVCLEQRRRVIEELATHGIMARCVVVADDENLDIARAKGFATVERDNEWLGRKFNDGMEYAGLNHAEWIVPIGSDSWIDPAYFLNLPGSTLTRASEQYAAVRHNRLAELRVATVPGAGPYVFHRSLLAPSGFRPAVDEIRKGVDGSTIRGIQAVHGPVLWQKLQLHPLQYVGFRGTPHITSYQRLVTKWGMRERGDPWSALRGVYASDLVERARLALVEDMRAAA